MKIKMHISAILALVLISGMLQVFAAGDKSEGLVFYYDYSETNGAKVPDLSGNGYDGEIVGSFKIVEDKERGKVGEFKGGNCYLKLDPDKIKDEGNIPTEAFSLLAWVNVVGDGDQAIFNAWSSDGQWLTHPEVRPGSGIYRWLVRGDKPEGTLGEVKAGKPEKGAWHHFAGTYDSATGKTVLYIDGKVVGSDERAGSKGKTVNENWAQGARVGFNVDNARQFMGKMDEISLWERNITKNEVNEIIELGLDGYLAVNSAEKLATTWATVKSKR